MTRDNKIVARAFFKFQVDWREDLLLWLPYTSSNSLLSGQVGSQAHTWFSWYALGARYSNWPDLSHAFWLLYSEVKAYPCTWTESWYNLVSQRNFASSWPKPASIHHKTFIRDPSCYDATLFSVLVLGLQTI